MNQFPSQDKSQPIHIALTFDDNYWAPAYATMRSVCLATHRRKDLVFHLCHRTLTKRHVADLSRITDEFGATLAWYDLDKDARFADIAARARYNRRLSNIVYARLMFGELLPATVTRLIYLDCDMYVRAPIEELAEMDMEGSPVAAVRDTYSFQIIGGRDIRANQDLFYLTDMYFNAGLLVIDMDAWRREGVLAKFEQVMQDGTLERIYYDQDFLNLAFHGRWKRLDTLWNVINPRAAHEAFDPKLLHYTDRRKPWNLFSFVAFARTYRHVMTNDLFYAYMRHRLGRRLGKLIGLKP
ncbi:MAG: glycosyltransferase family 8 protein [Alphaproteobacteria bacterium]|nr:glycosyltransferase family 8 protein [Alphaproteobacteria bacterium]